MDNYKVTPTQNGVKAPLILVEAKDHKEAEKLARAKSGLGRFEEWSFNPIKYTPKVSNGSRKRGYEN